MNCRHMTDDHHGRTAGRATLLVRAVDGLLGTCSLKRGDKPVDSVIIIDMIFIIY